MPSSCLTTDSLKEAFATAIGLTGTADWHSVAYGTTNGWDSMAHMQLVTDLENRFNIMLSTDEVISLSSFDKAKQIVESHGIRFES
jgi:acyl carrier protein